MKKAVIIAGTIIIIIFIIGYFSKNKGKSGSGSATPSQRPSSSPAKSEGKTISEKDLGYSLTIPENWVSEKNGQFSRLYYQNTSEPGAGPGNFLYISVVPKGFQGSAGEIYNYNAEDVSSMRKMEARAEYTVGGIENPELAQYFTYKREEDRMLGGYGAQVYTNAKPWEFPAGTTEHRYFIFFEEATFIIGSYTGGEISKNESDAVFSSLSLSPKTVKYLPPPAADAEWKQYDNKTAGVSFEYPVSWNVQSGSQNFQNGDLIAFVVIGQNQRPQTELYDGVSFAVMNPVSEDSSVEEWAKKTYGTTSEMDPESPPEYSKVSFGGKTYEKVYVCGLGCFTYFHTKQNGKIYGFMLMAAGPNSAFYESQASRLLSSVAYY